MSALHGVIASVALAAGAAIAVSVARDFVRGPAADELPLAVGGVPSSKLGHFLTMGYPWDDRRGDLLAMRREELVDPLHEAAKEADEQVKRDLVRLKVEMPAGTLAWPELFAALRAGLGAHGIEVLTGEPAVPDKLTLTLPEHEWTGATLLATVISGSQGLIHYT